MAGAGDEELRVLVSRDGVLRQAFGRVGGVVAGVAPGVLEHVRKVWWEPGDLTYQTSAAPSMCAKRFCMTLYPPYLLMRSMSGLSGMELYFLFAREASLDQYLVLQRHWSGIAAF